MEDNFYRFTLEVRTHWCFEELLEFLRTSNDLAGEWTVVEREK